MDNNSRKKATILIVDNDLTVCKLFEIFLENAGHNSITANSGLLALEILKTQHVDLILLDVMMPEMDGYEVCTRLQADPVLKKIPIIFVTAIDDNESYIRGLELGAIDYLNKPVNQLEFTVKIKNYLNLIWNEAELKESELRYKSIVEDQTELIIRFLPEGTISFVNKAFCNYVNKSQEELLGFSLNSKNIRNPLHYILPDIKTLNKDIPVRTGRRRIIFSEGRTSWLEWVDRALFDTDEQLVEFQCVGRDITIQKKYEDVIHLISDETSGIIGELFFDVLLTNIVKILNVDYAILGKFSDLNNDLISTFSVCKNGFIINDFELSFKNTKFSQKISSEIILHQFNENSSKEESITVLDEELASLASVPLFDENHSAIGVLVVLSKRPLQLPDLVIDLLKIFSIRAASELERSISDKKIQESEKKFKNIFQSSGDGIIITNFDHEILEANESFQKRFELNGEKNYLTSFIYYTDKKNYEKHFRELLNEESASTPVEVRMISAENKTMVYEIKHKVIEYQGSKSVLSILRDVTARNEMQVQILNTIMDTEEKERKRFAQDLHDGLGPLLSTIKLYSRSILSAKNEENKQIAVEKSIQTIDEAIASIKEIANNISPHVLRDFGLVVAVNSYINKFNDANNLNISFQHDINVRFESKIEVSLFRIVIELINNTYKHSYANNIIIGLDFSDNIIALSYADDGIGCDLSSIMGKSAGHGIANIISRTKTMNGEIDFKTAIDMGFFVKINIPAAIEVSERPKI